MWSSEPYFRYTLSHTDNKYTYSIQFYYYVDYSVFCSFSTIFSTFICFCYQEIKMLLWILRCIRTCLSPSILFNHNKLKLIIIIITLAEVYSFLMYIQESCLHTHTKCIHRPASVRKRLKKSQLSSLSSLKAIPPQNLFSLSILWTDKQSNLILSRKTNPKCRKNDL